jgi:hypothetical protein
MPKFKYQYEHIIFIYILISFILYNIFPSLLQPPNCKLGLKSQYHHYYIFVDIVIIIIYK